MYCKQCGSKIEDDSVYCSKCGIKLIKEIQKQEEVDKDKSTETCMRTLLIATMIVLLLFFITALSLDACNRDATNNDVRIEMQESLATMSIEIYILPNVNINDLELTIDCNDGNGKLLKTVTKRIGNVKKGNQVIAYIDSSDLGFLNLISVSQTRTKVSGGKIPII